MGDFKCNSGKVTDNKENYNETSDLQNQDNYNSSGNYNTASDNISSAGTAAASAAGAYGADKSQDYKAKSSSNDYSAKDEMDGGCGCGTTGGMNDSSSDSSDFSDDMQYPDDAQTATIYTETIIFTDPYAGVNDDPATSDLVEDQEEGSEYIASDSNRPQC